MTTVLIFNDGRNDYLEQTLTTFVEQVIFPDRPHMILIDDMPTGRDEDWLREIAARFSIDALILNPTNLGLFGSVMKSWSSLPEQTDFVFHLQNDFVFPRRIEVRQLQSVLEDLTICNITLLRQAWYEDEQEAGGIFNVRPERFREATIGGVPVCLHRDYFGLNPCLYRREFARVIPDPGLSPDGAAPWLEAIHRDILLAEEPRRQFAIMGRRVDPPAVVHIGYRRVGKSPDHSDPVRVDTVADLLSRRLHTLAREQEVLTERIQRLEAESGVLRTPETTPKRFIDSNSQHLETEVAMAEADLARLRATFIQMERQRATGVDDSDAHPLTGEEQSRPHVLVYHRVNSLPVDPAGLCVDQATFRAHMEEVARRFEPMSLADLAQAVASGSAPYNGVAITIDDGYLDAFDASTILLDLHLPVTLFVTSQAAGETFHDTLARIFIGPHSLPDSLDISISGRRLAIPRTADRTAAFRTASDFGFPMCSSDRRELVNTLRRWSEIDLSPRETHRLLTPAEVREFASRPRHFVGAHTENHLILPSQTPAAKRHEMKANKLYLEAVIGQEVSSLAYPYGIWDDETLETCRSLGFTVAVTVAGTVCSPWDDPLLIPRIERKGRLTVN